MTNKIKYRNLFHSLEHERQFSENGFFIVQKEIDADIIHQLKKYFIALFKDVIIKEGFSTPFDYFDLEKRLEVHKFITSQLNAIAQQLCINCSVYLSNYMIKTPEQSYTIDMHQDWSYVDETTNRSFNIWIPLEDTAINNGTMFVIPKTQFKNINTFRTPVIPLYFNEYKKEISNFIQPIYLKQCDCIIFDNSLIHGAFSNNSTTNRIAVVLCLKPNETPLQFLYPDKKDILVYKQADEYIFHFKDFLKDIYKNPNTGILTNRLNRANISNYSYNEIIKTFEALEITGERNFEKYFESNKTKYNFIFSLFEKLRKTILT